MILELLTLTNIVLFCGSMLAFFSSRKNSKGAQESATTANKISTSVLMLATHAVCSLCGCTVAKYETKSGNVICQNCKR